MPVSLPCVYHNDYYDQSLYGACAAEDSVPEGCPVHVATWKGEVPKYEVYRGMDPVMLQSSATVVDTYSVMTGVIDPFDCDCAVQPTSLSFDRYEVTLTGAVEGDVVAFVNGKLDHDTGIEIGPPGPCPAPQWPTEFSVATRCDRCPVDPIDPPGDDPPSEGSAAGCTVGGGAGWAAISVALAFGMRRRRRA